jgi:hypothetical protein
MMDALICCASGLAAGRFFHPEVVMKNAYVAKMEAEIKEWSARLSELKAKAEKATAQGRIEYQKKLELSQKKHDAAARKLAELKSAGEDKWEALKAGVESAWKELRSEIDKNPKN